MPKTWKKDELAARIDHTLLKPIASQEEIRSLCAEALRYNFASVCVHPCHVQLAARELKGVPKGKAPVVCTVIGFPLGCNATEIKADEARFAVKQGAQEIDMVINIGAAKSGEWKYVEDDIRAVVKASGKAIVKVIIETCYLSDAEKTRACETVMAAKAAFVKTSTGFGSEGATLDDIKLMKRAVGDTIRIKAAGGIRTTRDAIAMIEAGADRIGTSNGCEILAQLD